MSAFGNVTYQKTKKEGGIFDLSKLTDKLDYTPEWKGNVGLDFKLPYNAALSARQRFVGLSYTIYSFTAQGKTNYKLIKLDSYATTDLEVKISVTKHSELGIYAENIFDKKYEERYGYPLPGRIIGASVKIVL